MRLDLKFFSVVIVLILHGSVTYQNPVAQNYSTDILRLAKAAQIKAYINDEKEPCNNFYKYACGKWAKLHPADLVSEKSSYLEQLQDLYVRKSAEMLKGDRKIDTSVDIKLKDYFDSCRNNIDSRYGIEPTLNVIGLKGGWPKVTSPTWYEYEYDWLKVVAELRRKLGVDILIGLDVIPDFEDKDMHRIKVGAPQLNFKFKDAYFSDEYEMLREEYKQSISNKLRNYFSDMSDDWVKEIAEQVLYVEQQLAKGLPDDSKLTLKQTTRQRYAADLKAAYGNYVDLSRYLNIIFNQTIYVQVYETPEDYLSNLVEVIKQTPKLTIANYTVWRVLEQFELDNEVYRKPDENWCVQSIIKYFPHQLESMFYRNYNTMQMINELQSVWIDIKKTFREEFYASSQLNWITLDTRQKAVLKLDAIDLEVITHNEENFEEQMQGLMLRRDKYYENLINVLQWQTQHKLAKLIEKPQPPEEEVKLPEYQLTSNKIQIPITFLQARFLWDAAYPTALKYGTLGFLLAHELIHGFDTIGRKYDKHGYQRSWWDPISEKAFDERASCLTSQYESYKFQGKEVSVPNALVESIADNGGLDVAYRTYQKWTQNVAETELVTEVLPLLDHTPNQLFYISFAQLWCADYHRSVEKFTVLPERLRVIGALANSKEFAEEFKCEAGSKMNPEQKCKIY